MKTSAKRRAYNAKYYRNHLGIWARSYAKRKALRPIFTPKLDWSDRQAAAEYDRQRNAAYRAAHPTWIAEKCKAWRAKRRAVEAANLKRIGRSFLIA